MRDAAARSSAGGTAQALVGRRGMLYVADGGLTELLRREWPNWNGPLLPERLIDHLREIYRKLDVSDKAELARKLQAEPDEVLDLEGMPTLQELPGAATTFDRQPIG